MADINIQDLRRKWVHSFEEDTDEATVYRPDNFNFPRARGRVSMELKDNGSLTEFRIGRNDVPASGTGSWQLDGGRLVLNNLDEEGGRTFAIREASPEKLVLTKEQATG
jgi:hypothetical protein